VREKFESYEAIELEVVGFIDDTHPALAEFLKDFVVRYSVSDHRTLLIVPPKSSGILKIAATR
jgi:hypothetical protein